MRKKPTRKRPYFKMESAMTAILRDASGKMHHGILFVPPLGLNLSARKFFIRDFSGCYAILTSPKGGETAVILAGGTSPYRPS